MLYRKFLSQLPSGVPFIDNDTLNLIFSKVDIDKEQRSL
jgi:hypothetical protein